jgi:2',3'-cyclic-nucleotide 2'-phosphodiesterase (5'-nucleotidase family)
MNEERSEGTDRVLLTLLHTNDLHNHLTEAQAHRLRLLHESLAPSGLLVDAGDAVASGNITFRPGGEPILERMSEIGYDAMTVGNREFHFSQTGLQCKLSRAAFPVLSANMRPARSGTRSLGRTATEEGIAPYAEPLTDLPVRPYILLTTPSGWRVVLFGLTVPMITERMLSRKVSAAIFDPPLRTAQSLVPELRAKYEPDLLIALTHIGIAQDRLLAESVSGIDLIIGGHTHVVLEQGERVGETLIVQAGSHGRYVGRVEAQREAGRLHLRAKLETL